MSAIHQWFAARGWEAFPFQEEVWAAYRAGRSGLIHAPTGLGKTLAAWLGPVAEGLESRSKGLKVLWLSPLRALALDTAQALREPLGALGLDWEVGRRTGDSSAKERAQWKTKLPDALVTTPESLSVMLSDPGAAARLAGLEAVIVDEWHELLSSKRGVQTELCLARLRAWNPGLRVWGLSATLGNLPEAMQALLGDGAPEGVLVSGQVGREVCLETLLPEEGDPFPWSGHLGLSLLPAVARQIGRAATTLVFTNTRSQAEQWHQALREACPDWAGDLAVHHGSLEKAERQAVEDRLREGTVKAVVCTSSLDLGVDFSPVEQVIQIGSPKGVARLLQRAGRSGHRPGAVSRVYGVPTHAFELVEFAAARQALGEGRIEARRPLRLALDVLAQHLCTVAAGGGFAAEALLREVRSTHAFAELDEASWDWVLGFIASGGKALRAYPEYAKVRVVDGRYVMEEAGLLRRHRMGIGTISSDPSISVQFSSGRRLGTVEESWISRIKPGGVFLFGGRRLELVSCRELRAVVREERGKRQAGQIPTWVGGKSPLSTELAAAVSRKLEAAGAGQRSDPEMQWLGPVLALQEAWSAIPRRDQLLIEEVRTREGYHLYVYPFAGRLVHEGLGTLVAWRMARQRPLSLSVSANDYGFELSCAEELSAEEWAWPELFSREGLREDLLACLNTAELGRRQFRGIARVSGLVIGGFPGQPKSSASLQVSAGLLYDVFAKYDPENLLLKQARNEVLEQQLECARLEATLEELGRKEIVIVRCPRLTPLSFPLWSDLASSRLSTESFAARLEKMKRELAAAAGAAGQAE